MADIMEEHARMQRGLEDHILYLEAKLQKSQTEASLHELRVHKETLQPTLQSSGYETKKLKDELSASVKQINKLETEVRVLREKVAGKDSQIRQLEGINSKSSDEISRKDEEIRHKDRAILLKNEEIRSLSSSSRTARVGMLEV